MATLSASTDITIPATPAETETLELNILLAAAPGEGSGRLVHPVLGTYDYAHKPNRWQGIDVDVIVPPIWAHSPTLAGGADTLWNGSIRDIVCSEHWDYGGAGSTIEHLRMLLAFWQNPPAVDQPVLWFPQYTSVRGFKVAITDVSAGGQSVSLDYITRSGYVRGAVAITYRILGRAEDA